MKASNNTTFGLLLANHPNRHGYYPVMLRITRNRKTRRIKTDFEVRKSDWNQKARNYRYVRDCCPSAEQMNRQLFDLIGKYRSAYLKLKEEGRASVDSIIEHVRGSETSESFYQYALQQTRVIYDGGGIRSWKKYNSFCHKLKAFMDCNGMHDLTFVELSPALLSQFDAFLHRLPNERYPGKLLHPNTIFVNLNVFKTLVNRAIRIDDKLRFEANPFLKYKYGSVKTEKAKLDAAEIEAIKSLPLESGSPVWHCRNYFLFSFYCAGIRVGDLIQLRWCNVSNQGRLRYQMGKNHKIRDLALIPESLAILKNYAGDQKQPQDYIFPILNPSLPWARYVTQSEKDTMTPDMKRHFFTTISSKNAMINKNLTRMARMAGIPKKLSFHMARHSFAKYAKEKGLDNLEVKALLAHSNLSTTQNYMGEFETEKTDAALISVFSDDRLEAELLSRLQQLSPHRLRSLLGKLQY